MTTSSQKAARDRLSWVEDARQGILRAIGDDVVQPLFKAHPTVDPLKYILRITLRHPLAKETRPHIRAYLRCMADATGCDVPVIRITDQWIQAEVLTVHRYWSRDDQGRFKKRPKRFERRSR
jgi:hypothetical protein